VSIKSLETEASRVAGKRVLGLIFLREIAENRRRAAISRDKLGRSVGNWG
jgi:hypothetical protein